MYRGFILSESLNNPTLLNNLENIYVNIEEHPESHEFPFWHLYKVEVKDEDILKITKNIANNIKRNWYAHFWNGKDVYIVFSGKIFSIPREHKWSSEKFQQVKKFAIENGIEERYLDFWIEE